MTFDTVIRGGRVFDPAAGLDAMLDVGVRDGKIEAVAAGLPADGARLVDATGKLVSPGFIDTHLHIYGGIGLVDPDTVGVHQGVTTIVDFGGAGTATFDQFKGLTLPRAKTRIYSVVCLTAGGVGAAGFGTDDQMEIGRLDLRRFFELVDANRDVIRGLKSMVSVTLGPEFLMLAKSVAYSARLPLVLHLGEFDDYVKFYPGPEYRAITSQVLDQLDAGDLITHCFTPEPGRMFDEAGTMLPTIRETIDRGVFLDLGHSSHGFSAPIARAAIAQGIVPHTLGTDLHVSSVGPIMRSLADVMSKMLALGMSFDSVMRAVTCNAAKWLRIEDRAGTLARGFPADVTIFEIQDGDYPWVDSHRNPFEGTQRIVPSGCLKDGVWYPARMEIVDTRANRNIAVAKESMPAPVAGFSDAQRQYLGEVATIVGRSASWNPIALN